MMLLHLSGRRFPDTVLHLLKEVVGTQPILNLTDGFAHLDASLLDLALDGLSVRLALSGLAPARAESTGRRVLEPLGRLLEGMNRFDGGDRFLAERGNAGLREPIRTSAHHAKP